MTAPRPFCPRCSDRPTVTWLPPIIVDGVVMLGGGYECPTCWGHFTALQVCYEEMDNERCMEIVRAMPPAERTQQAVMGACNIGGLWALRVIDQVEKEKKG